MRQKTLRIAAVTAFVLTLGAGASPLVIVTDKNDRQTITIAVGQQLDVRLPSNPTTGYQWTAGVLHAGPVALTRPAAFQQSSSGLLGAGGTQVFSYRGVATGRVQLSFDYARSWEHTAPAKHLAITVVVRSRPL